MITFSVLIHKFLLYFVYFNIIPYYANIFITQPVKKVYNILTNVK